MLFLPYTLNKLCTIFTNPNILILYEPKEVIQSNIILLIRMYGCHQTKAKHYDDWID
jgi:hypothetical protein